MYLKFKQLTLSIQFPASFSEYKSTNIFTEHIHFVKDVKNLNSYNSEEAPKK